MNSAIASMLKQYGPVRNSQDAQNALKEIVQQITLSGLHRGGLFRRAAFYGGTALRILYQLDRFSEDMDFCLHEPDPEFSLQPYLTCITEELERFGFDVEVTEKRKCPEAPIGSAFVKQNTIQGLMVIGHGGMRGFPKSQRIKVRLEIDKLNPPGGIVAHRLVKLPVPFLVTTLTLPSLFAGKIHAILARAYLNRVKGRDYYDFLFLGARDVPVNLTYLEAKLRDSGHWSTTIISPGQRQL